MRSLAWRSSRLLDRTRTSQSAWRASGLREGNFCFGEWGGCQGGLPGGGNSEPNLENSPRVGQEAGIQALGHRGACAPRCGGGRKAGASGGTSGAAGTSPCSWAGILNFCLLSQSCHDNNKLRKESRDFFIFTNIVSDARQEAALFRCLCGRKEESGVQPPRSAGGQGGQHPGWGGSGILQDPEHGDSTSQREHSDTRVLPKPR